MSSEAFERRVVATFGLLKMRCMFRPLMIGCIAGQDMGIMWCHWQVLYLAERRRFSPSAAESPLHHLSVHSRHLTHPATLYVSLHLVALNLFCCVYSHPCVPEGFLYAL